MSRLHCNSTATTVSSVQFLFSLCRRTQSAFSKISPVIPSVVVFKKPQQKKHLFCWAALYYTGLLYIVSPKYQPSLILMPGCVWFCFPLDSCITPEPSRNTVIFYIISSLLLISCTKLNLRSVLLLFHTQTMCLLELSTEKCLLTATAVDILFVFYFWYHLLYFCFCTVDKQTSAHLHVFFQTHFSMLSLISKQVYCGGNATHTGFFFPHSVWINL